MGEESQFPLALDKKCLYSQTDLVYVSLAIITFTALPDHAPVAQLSADCSDRHLQIIYTDSIPTHPSGDVNKALPKLKSKHSTPKNPFRKQSMENHGDGLEEGIQQLLANISLAIERKR